MPEYDDATLERIMREGLGLRAGEAAEELEGPLPVASSRPSRGRWLAVAAAVVLLAGAGWAVRSSHDAGSPGPLAVDRGGSTAGWRVESYGGVQLRVPPGWGLGGSPLVVHVPGHGPEVCDDHLSGDAPYVGRPLMLSDLCSSWSVLHGPAPKADTVWFDSPFDLGTTQVAGRTAETVAVGDQHVTVFSENVALRVAILDSAEPVAVDDNGCPTTGGLLPAPGDPRDPQSLSVCAYTATSGDSHKLLWSGRIDDPSRARDYARATSSDHQASPKPCSRLDDEISVVVAVRDGAGAAIDWATVDPGCRRIYLTDMSGEGVGTWSVPLVPATVEPWALPGIKAYVPGPADPGDLAPYFRGMLG